MGSINSDLHHLKAFFIVISGYLWYLLPTPFRSVRHRPGRASLYSIEKNKAAFNIEGRFYISQYFVLSTQYKF